MDADDNRDRGALRAPDEPGALQILISEHASLSSARSLAYNEAFTRGNMFLGFLSMSLVALVLISQASPGRDFLTITAVVLAFDLVVGLTTFGRILAAGAEYGQCQIYSNEPWCPSTSVAVFASRTAVPTRQGRRPPRRPGGPIASRDERALWQQSYITSLIGSSIAGRLRREISRG